MHENNWHSLDQQNFEFMKIPFMYSLYITLYAIAAQIDSYTWNILFLVGNSCTLIKILHSSKGVGSAGKT